LKEVKKQEMSVLVNNGVIKNTSQGFIDGRGYPVGFYRTRNKRYLEDRYVDMAKNLLQEKA
jgi:hypothetical protein